MRPQVLNALNGFANALGKFSYILRAFLVETIDATLQKRNEVRLNGNKGDRRKSEPRALNEQKCKDRQHLTTLKNGLRYSITHDAA